MEESVESGLFLKFEETCRLLNSAKISERKVY